MAALAKAQGSFPDIERNRTVRVTPRSGGQAYEFKYATLSAIFHAIKKPLSDNGIVYTQVISHDADGGFYVLTTTLFCGDQFISSKVPLIAEGGSNQQFGSALTYMKRYALAALLGIAADEDDDGNAADGNAVIAVKDKVAAPPKSPAEDPISTGPILMDESTRIAHLAMGKISGSTTPKFSDNKIDVPMLADESGSDWMMWGQSFMGAARLAPDLKSLEKLEKNNFAPLKSMETSAPKMFANLSVALVKAKQALTEKKNA